MTTPDAPTSKLDTQLWRKFTDVMLGYTKSYALKAVVELGIPDILAKAGGPLTLDEIASKLPSKTVNLDYLSRIMNYTSLIDLFTEMSDPNVVVVDEGHRRFGLTPLSSLLVEDSAHPLMCLAPMVRFQMSKNAITPWMNFSGAVLSDTEPFQLTHGKGLWELAAGDPEWSRILNNGMASGASHILGLLMKVYQGFRGINQLVDVGGGVGATLATITQSYPDLHGINFDLPSVIAEAPEIPGVKHVSGDMFQSVPEGDAIIMKWILHDWSDEKSIVILKNCYKSLPQNGKVILIESVLVEPRQAEQYALDLIMLAHTSGKERSNPQWRKLLKAGGFERMEIIPMLTPPMCAIEGYKS